MKPQATDAEDTALPVILVTGASGFLGRELIQHLTGRFDLIALDREALAEPLAGAEFVALDLTSDRSVEAALQRVRTSRGARIASVIHLAAYFDLSGEPDPRYDEVTVEGTARLLDGLAGFEVEQFIFMSTMLVHQPSGHDHRIDESSPLDHRFPYRASKIRTEAAIREHRGSIPTVVLRPAGVYDRLCHNAFLADHMSRVYEKRPSAYLYPGDQQAGQAYLQLDDLIDAVQRAIQRRYQLAEQTELLLAESDVMSFAELQACMQRLMHGETWKTRQVPETLALAGSWAEDELLGEQPFIRPWMVRMASDRYAVDCTRAKLQLQWQPRHSLRASLPEMIRALRSDPVEWYRANDLDAARVSGTDDAEQSRLRRAGRAPASPHAPGKMKEDMRAGHFRMLWVHWTNILLGAWLLAMPFALGSFGATDFSASVLHVSADRGLADPQLRSLWLARSDVASGLLVMLFGLLSLSPRFSWAQWGNAAVGCWLLLAPLVFWSPSAAVYNNDTIVGALVIAFAVLIPMMPGMSMEGMADPADVPPGWSYSPSSYLQRLPIIALGLFGFLLARVLAAYQMGHIAHVADPFFAGQGALNGTETIITSSVSKAWPVPDAGLGAVAYMFEVLMGAMGDARRWRTMPWMVAMFGIVVVPLGVISIYFIVIQPIVIGTWCTLCLITAAAMLAMIPYSLDEIVAMCQYLRLAHRRGDAFWRIFFRGGAQTGGSKDRASGFDAPLRQALASAGRGVTYPGTLVAAAGLGALLMFTRLVFGTVPPMALGDHLAGALILSFSVIALAEVARPLRWLNIPVGLWLMVAPWRLEGASLVASCASVLIGLAVCALSLPRGRRSEERYGGWDGWIL